MADALPLAAAAPGAHPPPPPTHLAPLRAAADRLATRFDLVLERGAPRELNPFAQLGAAVNALLLLAVASGVAVLIWYSPSVGQAWSSLADLGPRSPGGLIRSVHRYASDLLMLLLLAHALRTFVARKFAGPRWLAWTSGVALLGLVWFIGWTGYWLVWDVRAQVLALDTIRAVDVLPVFGEPMLRLFVSDRTVPSLLFFVVFFLHMVLPLAIAAGLGLHLARLSLVKLLPDWRLSAWLTSAVVAAALVFPATNAAAAQMAVKPAAFTLDWWYLWPLAVSGRLSGGGIWLVGLLALMGLMTVPWWLARRRPRAVFQATVDVSRCFSCTLCSHDCPFGAITMVPRTDGKPFPSQAQIDPDRCIGCGVCAGACDTQGIGLPWFDARQLIRELETFVVAGVAQGHPRALAFVCAQSDGGWELFNAAAWSTRLPGYSVHRIPCSGWIEPKLIERLISKGAAAVLIVGCGSAEVFCKEGNRWMPERIAGSREPAFRPNRADPRKVAHVNFDLLRPGLLTAAAHQLRQQSVSEKPARRGLRLSAWAMAAGLTALTLAGLLFASAAPFRNPATLEPEFVFSFHVNGEWLAGAAAALPDPALDTRPVHMRTALPADRTRSPVVVRVAVDGKTQEQTYRPKGLQSDGASVGELRVPLSPGIHRISVAVATTPDPATPTRAWAGEVEAKEGRLSVLTYAADHGFELEP